jgi:glycosyltransferase involved in cell wall biosynthesis
VRKESAVLNHLLVNLSFITTKPTGHTVHITNLLPALDLLKPTLLVSQTLEDYSCYQIPAKLTPDQGSKGHFRRIWWTQWQLPEIYEELRSHLLFSPIPEAPLYTRCRFVVMVHDLIPLRFPRFRSPLTHYFRYYVPQVLAQAEHILCNSMATARDITDFFHIPAARITPILLAYDAHHYRLEAINQLDLPQDCPYFLYIGRHDPYKNLHRLIDAFAALPNCRDYELWLAGSTDQRYTPQMKAQAEKLGITQQVKFLDYVPYNQLPRIINQAIALVFPSLWEGFGFPVLEAMACGTPVITSNCSSLPEVAGEAALLVNPYNVGEITAAMQAVVGDADLRSHLSTLGLNHVRQFSWAKTGQATAEVLQQYL